MAKRIVIDEAEGGYIITEGTTESLPFYKRAQTDNKIKICVRFKTIDHLIRKYFKIKK